MYPMFDTFLNLSIHTNYRAKVGMNVIVISHKLQFSQRFSSIHILTKVASHIFCLLIWVSLKALSSFAFLSSLDSSTNTIPSTNNIHQGGEYSGSDSKFSYQGYHLSPRSGCMIFIPSFKSGKKHLGTYMYYSSNYGLICNYEILVRRGFSNLYK